MYSVSHVVARVIPPYCTGLVATGRPPPRKVGRSSKVFSFRSVSFSWPRGRMLRLSRRLYRSMTVPRSIVAVIGTTGSGKSQLAVALAKSLPPLQHQHEHDSTSSAAGPSRRLPALPPQRGVVLSADSMQLYRGLDVITNKATVEEQAGVEHWGLDVVSPGGGAWELGRWCLEAEKKVSALPPDELPIICGGTHYFIQHFLFPPPELRIFRSSPPGSSKGKSPHTRWEPPCPLPPTPDLPASSRRLLETFWTPCPSWPGKDEPSFDTAAGPSSRATVTDDSQLLALWNLLNEVDEREAGRWHWRDGRKVRRGLERWWEAQAAPMSNTAAGEEQAEQVDNAGRRAKFRTLIFWVYERMETLRPRLDKRVDKMLANGLLREIAELRGVAERIYGSSDVIDHTEGIFQSIGYKEFADLPLPQPDPPTDPRFPAMVDRTKLSTVQYAKSQLKWITKQLLPAVREARALGGEVCVYVVPGGEEGEAAASRILAAFLNGEDMPAPSTLGHPDAAELLAVLEETNDRLPDTAERQLLNVRRQCEICSTAGRPYTVLGRDWDAHLKSRLHRRQMRDARGEDEKAAWIAELRRRGEQAKLDREAARSSGTEPVSEAEAEAIGTTSEGLPGAVP